MRDFNEIFRNDVTYDNVKSHKKPRLHPSTRRYIFGKTTGVGVKLTPHLPILTPHPSLVSVKLNYIFTLLLLWIFWKNYNTFTGAG